MNPRPPEGKHSPNSEWCCSCLDEMNAKLVMALEDSIQWVRGLSESDEEKQFTKNHLDRLKALLKEAKK